MEINIDLNKSFVDTYNKLHTEYGEPLAKLNGFSNRQLNYTEFIDNFIDKETVADASIDGNANVGNKDIVTLLSEMAKPHQKLLAAHKIYYEMCKKYDEQTAVEWFENEYKGYSYLHDFPTSTFVHYCFRGDTKILTKKGVKPLKELVDQDIFVLNKNRGWEKATVKNFGKQELRKLTLERYVTKEIYVTGNHVWFVKDGNKLKEIQTDALQLGMKIPFNTNGTWSRILPSPFGVAHGFFTGDGAKNQLQANFCGDKTALLPYFTPANISGNEKEYTTFGMPKYFQEFPSLDESPTYLYGWLSGYFAADGCVDEQGRCTIASAQKENLEFVRDVLCVLGMPVNKIKCQERISNLTNEMSTIYTLTLSEEYLKEDFFIRPTHKERFKPNKERKNRSWIVKNVEKTEIIEDVYCVVAPQTESFTLDNNVLTHNCFAYDLKDLAEKGLFFIDNFNFEPPKHLVTFVDFVKEFISYTCTRSSGAVGLPNLIPYLYYFWDRDVKANYWNGSPEKYAKQNIQRVIYALNQPFLRGTQSAFTNTSIFDRPYLEALFGGATFPDGAFMIDELDGIMEFQKMFLEEMSRIRSKNMMTFPVNSISLLYQNGKFVDEEFARWACAHNMKWSDSNFFIDDSVTSLSNCCFDGSQVCIVRKFNMRCYLSFEQLYNTVGEDKTIEIFHKGDWKNGKVVRLPGRKMYKIKMISNRIITVTDNHLNPTIDGDKPTTALTTDDYLLCDFLDMSGLQYDKIKSIEEIPEIPEYVYCFEMENQEEPYFTLANGIITHNCRLKSDINELGYFNSVGGTALKVGSVKVNTVNLARLALENDTEDEYIESLKKVLNLTLKSLDCVRHIIKRNVDKGLLKNFSLGIVDFEHLYNTVGVIGIYEAIKKFGYTKTDELGNTYYTDEAFAFGKKIFDTIHAVNADFAKDKDYKINVEQIPGETAASKLMQKDLIFHPDTTVTDLPLYGNQFIPLGITTTLQERMRIASAFDSFCNGGSIWHCNIEAPFNNFEQAWKMLNYVAEQGITYFAFNTKIQACKHNHGFYGKTCPECGEPVETEYSRIVGFYVPIKTYSQERKAEYSMRKWMDVNNVN